jgi:hypothetical protein
MRRTASCLSLLLMATAVHAQTFNPPLTVQLGGEAGAVAIADVQGEGAGQVLVYTGYANDAAKAGVLHVLANDPFGGLVSVASAKLATNYVTRVSLGVARGPGGTPIAVAGNGTQLHAARINGSDITFTTLSTVIANDYVAVLDLDRDGIDEVFSHSWSNGGAVYGFNAAGALQLRYRVATRAAGWNDLAVGDLTDDQIPDVAVMSGQYYLSPHVTILPGDGFGNLLAPQEFRTAASENVDGIAVGDLNGDGLDDIVLARGRNSPTWLWFYLQTPGGGLDGPHTVPTYDIPSDMTISDIDGDGWNELLVLHDGWARMSVYSTGPQGIIPSPEAVPLPFGYYGAHSLSAGDVTGDGCIDVAIAAGNAGLQFLTAVGCVQPSNDLAAGIAFTSSDVVRVSASSLAGTVPAEQVDVDVQLAVTRGGLTIAAPAGCVATGTYAFRCSTAQVAVSNTAAWSFSVRGNNRNATLTVSATVSAATPDPDLSNNAATAAKRL